MRRAATLLIGLGLLAALAVPLLIGGEDALRTLARFPASSYLLLIAVAIVGWVFRAAKLGLLMHQLDVRPGASRIAAISLATELAFLATPGGVGGYAAGVFYLRGAGATLSGAGSIAAADQLIDLLFFAVALPLALIGLIEVPLPYWLREAALFSVAIASSLVAIVMVARRPLARWLFASDGALARIPLVRRHSEALKKFCTDCERHLCELARGGPRFVVPLIVCTTAQWTIRYGLLWLIAQRLGNPVPFALLLLAQSVALHAAQWTGVPSSGGGADLGLAAALASWMPAANIASALILWRFATVYIGVVAGLIAVVYLRRKSIARAGALPAII
jgi:glycosyltransferase 2 family protein